ncbi:TPA: hypothetical protein ACGO3J_000607 [Streptococcus suis]
MLPLGNTNRFPVSWRLADKVYQTLSLPMMKKATASFMYCCH